MGCRSIKNGFFLNSALVPYINLFYVQRFDPPAFGIPLKKGDSIIESDSSPPYQGRAVSFSKMSFN